MVTRYWLRIAAFLCIATCVAICARRVVSIHQAVSLAPGVAMTSGCEEETLSAVWAVAHGQSAYPNALQVPYTATYFNWLFYKSYAMLLKPVVARYGGDGLLLGGRMVSALFLVSGIGFLLWVLIRESSWPRLVLGALACFALTGPLVSWWGFTVRPDIGALVFDVAGLAVFFRLYRSRVIPATVMSAVLFFMAWSFKQSFVFGIGTILLFLAWRRSWRALFLGGLTWGGLCLLTWVWAGPAYRASMADMATHNDYVLSVGLDNLGDMLRKTSPLWIACLGACFGLTSKVSRGGAAAPAGNVESGNEELRTLGILGLGLSMALSFLACCKDGAWSNYFFYSSVMLVLIAASTPCNLRTTLAMASALSLATLLQLAVLAGVVSQISLQPQSRELAERWEKWKSMPEPRFSYDTRLNLPWLNSNTPSFVLAFNYVLDRRDGRKFEAGGIGGLIENGYFRSLALPSGGLRSYDGGSLKGYVEGGSCADFYLWKKHGTKEGKRE